MPATSARGNRIGQRANKMRTSSVQWKAWPLVQQRLYGEGKLRIPGEDAARRSQCRQRSRRTALQREHADARAFPRSIASAERFFAKMRRAEDRERLRADTELTQEHGATMGRGAVKRPVKGICARRRMQRHGRWARALRTFVASRAR
ncbi:hypothetical protein ERJ75_000582500 [Trypanosoma vivax]|nr:hypothetical protein ERJ75_000582500 [Trypanosoma vivax]